MLTITELSKALGLPPYVVDYAVKRFGPEPQDRAGNIRLWGDNQLDEVRASLKRTASKSLVRQRSQVAS